MLLQLLHYYYFNIDIMTTSSNTPILANCITQITKAIIIIVINRLSVDIPSIWQGKVIKLFIGQIIAYNYILQHYSRLQYLYNLFIYVHSLGANYPYLSSSLGSCYSPLSTFLRHVISGNVIVFVYLVYIKIKSHSFSKLWFINFM